MSLSTLEHIRRDQEALSEMWRILRPGGLLVLAVPFLYRVHGSPSDFHRHTAEWWHRALSDLGCPGESIVIEPMAWDVLAAGLSLTEGWYPPGFPAPRFLRAARRAFVLAYGVVSAAARHGRSERMTGERGHVIAEYVLGYVIRATKPKGV
jgi:SAM-dependent methyltransferase